MKNIRLIIVLYFFAAATISNAQRLDRFGAETGSSNRNGSVHRLGYTDIKSYYGYIEPGSVPDKLSGGRFYYYLYFYISDTLPEIGVRMIAPVPELISPDKGDFASENYFAMEKEKSLSFNTWIELERAEQIKSKEEISEKIDDATWKLLGFNDDAEEMFNKTNSLLRLKSNPREPLIPGLYRVAFTSSGKKEEVKGGFLIQVGSTVLLPGVKLTKQLEELDAE